MRRSNSKSLENRVVSLEEEKGRAAVGRICRKKGYKPGMYIAQSCVLLCSKFRHLSSPPTGLYLPY